MSEGRAFLMASHGLRTELLRSMRVCVARSGQLHCPMCQRPAVDYHTLAQHMKDKHDFEPPARGPVTVSLSDLLHATR